MLGIGTDKGTADESFALGHGRSDDESRFGQVIGFEVVARLPKPDRLDFANGTAAFEATLVAEHGHPA